MNAKSFNPYDFLLSYDDLLNYSGWNWNNTYIDITSSINNKKIQMSLFTGKKMFRFWIKFGYFGFTRKLLTRISLRSWKLFFLCEQIRFLKIRHLIVWSILNYFFILNQILRMAMIINGVLSTVQALLLTYLQISLFDSGFECVWFEYLNG